ncbi:B12-binding domain-containing radical SAM protein [uncultured Sphaerochaeta sp.]|uniref:B12-binding domain-containing radical SAM protein n=1 Tax=uncultured Sphaerochaeta sp. TaxID=886478 RepID=UPI002AA6CEAB|nr:B12-binding domain-containing radical SAM protein [uncultured Sphaerochaeta sp.]
MNISLVSCCLEEGNLSYPLGALCIQSALEAADMRAEHLPFTLADDPSQAALNVARLQAQVVGLSVYLWNRTWMDRFTEVLRAQSSDLVIFAGGPEATANPSSFDLSMLDFLILGEGEEAVVQAISAIKEGKKIAGKGIVTNLNKLSWAPSPDLSVLPSPLLNHHADRFLKAGSSVLWEMTRGCPFHCSFCFESRGQRSVRHFPLAQLEAELDLLIAKQVGEVYILDPTFNMDKERTLTILSMLAEKQSDIHFVFEIRAELLDNELADAFARINCALQIGLQSSDQAVLKTANRRFDSKLFSKKISFLNARGIPFGLDLIIGLPNDNLRSFIKSVDYAVSLKPSNLDVFPLSLLPGTLVAEQAKEFSITHLQEAPYTIIESPSFPQKDMQKALVLKESLDLFFTKGQAGMWLQKLSEVVSLSPSSILFSFSSFLEAYLKRSGEQADDIDIYLLQETFVRSFLRKLGLVQYEAVMLSFIELHQGIAFFHECGESPVLQLSYSLDALSEFEHLTADAFLKRYPEEEEEVLGITSDLDGRLLFVPLQ